MGNQCLGPRNGFMESREMGSKGVRGTETEVLRRKILGIPGDENSGTRKSRDSGNENRVGVLSTLISGATRIQGNGPR